jgi:hypothetical protein
MLTARLPFEAPTVMALLSKHLMETPPPPSQRRPDLAIPPVIDELVMGAMAKDPAQRPATMEALGEHIAAVLATLPPDPTAPSAPISVPYVPAPAVPPSFAPSTPPPTGAAPHATPALTPPVMQGPPPVVPKPARPQRSNQMLLFVIIGALVLGGAAAAYFLTRPAPEPKKDDPWKNADDPSEEKHELEEDDHEHEQEETPDAPEEEENAVDPWGGQTSAGASTGSIEGNTVDIGQGAKFVAPPSFIVQNQGTAVTAIDASRGMFFAFAPLESDTDDPKVLAKRYAKATGLKLRSTGEDFLQGAKRPFAVFDGNIGGMAVRHVVIAFIGSSYRLAMIIHVPQSLANDASVKALSVEAVTRRLQLP